MFSKVTILGNLGREPELRYLADGTAVCNLSVATNKTITSNGKAKTITTWYRVSVWRKSAEACNQHLRLGSQVYIEGELQVDPKTGGPRIYTRNDGKVGASFEVTANMVKFVGKKPQAEAEATELAEEVPF